MRPDVALSNVEARRYRKKDGSVIDVEVTSHGLTFEGRDAELDNVLRHGAERTSAVARGTVTGTRAPDASQSSFPREGSSPDG